MFPKSADFCHVRIYVELSDFKRIRFRRGQECIPSWKNGPLAGLVPSSGLYFKDDIYFYSGNSDSLIPTTSGRLLQNIDATALINLATITWVSDIKLGGGTLGAGLTIPYGYQDITADFELTGPRGNVFASDIEGDVTGFGDPIMNVALGWHNGFHHWNLYSAVWVPVGDYDQERLTNMGTNRWSGDIGAGFTRLNTENGREASAIIGVTFNSENPDTDYQTGTELHLEFALQQHLPCKLSFGLIGYYYQQLSGDNGDGAVLGDFKGRVASLGPLLSYTFENNVSLNARWYHEFEAKNRVEGDAILATLTIPFQKK